MRNGEFNNSFDNQLLLRSSRESAKSDVSSRESILDVSHFAGFFHVIKNRQVDTRCRVSRRHLFSRDTQMEARTSRSLRFIMSRDVRPRTYIVFFSEIKRNVVVAAITINYI